MLAILILFWILFSLIICPSIYAAHYRRRLLREGEEKEKEPEPPETLTSEQVQREIERLMQPHLKVRMNTRTRKTVDSLQCHRCIIHRKRRVTLKPEARIQLRILLLVLPKRTPRTKAMTKPTTTTIPAPFVWHPSKTELSRARASTPFTLPVWPIGLALKPSGP